jgi:hypothetical protein
MQKNVFAYTASGDHYPEYLSLNNRDGQLFLAVRSPAEGAAPGTLAELPLPREEAKALYYALQAELLPATDA